MHIFGIFLFRSFQASFCVSASHTIILVRLVNHRHAECAGCRIRQCKFPQLGNPIQSFLTRFGTQELSIPGRASTFEPVPLQDIVKVMFRFHSSLFFFVGTPQRTYRLWVQLTCLETHAGPGCIPRASTHPSRQPSKQKPDVPLCGPFTGSFIRREGCVKMSSDAMLYFCIPAQLSVIFF